MHFSSYFWLILFPVDVPISKTYTRPILWSVHVEEGDIRPATPQSSLKRQDSVFGTSSNVRKSLAHTYASLLF